MPNANPFRDLTAFACQAGLLPVLPGRHLPWRRAAALMALLVVSACGSDEAISSTQGSVSDATGADTSGQIGDATGGDSLGGGDTQSTDTAATSDAAGTDVLASSDVAPTDSGALTECMDTFGCIDTCKAGGGQEQQCVNECLIKLPKDVQADFVGFAGCLQEGKLTSDPTCPAKVNACLKPNGTGTCMDYLACTQACGADGAEWNAACTFGCLKASDPNKTTGVLKALGCFDKQDTACQITVQECFSDTKGTQTCGQVANCGAKCQEGDEKCGFACLQNGSPQANKEFLQVQQCFDSEQSSSLCNGIVGGCLGTGTGTCSQGLSCVAACTEGEVGCFFGCFGVTTAASATQLFAVAKCLDGMDGANCPTDVASCINPNGNKNCWGVLQCQIDTCPGSWSCGPACWQQGNQQALKDLFGAQACTDGCKATCTAGDATCEQGCETTCGAKFPACLPPKT
jgi:hypothetical protein